MVLNLAFICYHIYIYLFKDVSSYICNVGKNVDKQDNMMP